LKLIKQTETGTEKVVGAFRAHGKMLLLRKLKKKLNYKQDFKRISKSKKYTWAE